ncbi:MAG TPA: TOBE domain-containing protein [Thermoanaerobaculia bacterium]|jgi:molybdopterin-binding protein
MELSARNQLHGKIRAVKHGTVMSEITIEIGGGQTLVSTITRASAERMRLSEGDSVVAIVKATEILIAK